MFESYFIIINSYFTLLLLILHILLLYLIILMHLYSIIETVLYMFYEAILNKSVYSLHAYIDIQFHVCGYIHT